MIKRIWCCLVFASILHAAAQSPQKTIFVERIPEIIVPVHSICKSRNGFLWVGRWDGLYRYDGKKFKSFKYISKSWTNFSIASIEEDQDGMLWIDPGLHDQIVYNQTRDSAISLINIFPQTKKVDLF
ncbi:MAG TPA: hypothetical protein VFU05_16360, partial [Cyclobacteriaceae bacterium]|nr:hypothetical protein [Cyclobacteriaceae bacterium]